MTAGEKTSSSADHQAADRRLEHLRRARAGAGTAARGQQRLAEQQRDDAADHARAPRRRRAPPGARGDRSGTWKSGSLPRIERSTITEATDATTVEPSRAAFMSPMISSSAKITAATGVLNAAESAPAAPTGTRSRTRSRRQLQPASDDRGEPGADLHRRTFASHRVAGADAQHAGQELANRHAGRNDAAVRGDRPPPSAARRCRARPETPSPAARRSRG